jgi:hypothetical protein
MTVLYGMMGAVSAICGGIDVNGLVRNVISDIRRERMARNLRGRWPKWKPRTKRFWMAEMVAGGYRWAGGVRRRGGRGPVCSRQRPLRLRQRGIALVPDIFAAYAELRS